MRAVVNKVARITRIPSQIGSYAPSFTAKAVFCPKKCYELTAWLYVSSPVSHKGATHEPRFCFILTGKQHEERTKSWILKSKSKACLHHFTAQHLRTWVPRGCCLFTDLGSRTQQLHDLDQSLTLLCPQLSPLNHFTFCVLYIILNILNIK